MHWSETKPMPSHLQSSLALPKPVPQPPHNSPIVKLSLLPQRKAWTSTVQSSNAIFSQKKTVTVANRATGVGSLQTAQPNCSSSHQTSEAIQRLKNIRTVLKGLKNPAIFSFSEILFKSHKKETSFDWTFLHFRPMATFSPPQEFKAVSRGELCISKIFLKARF